MILAHHVIITAYGFWLPNDPRGSGSDFIRNPRLLEHGHATPVTTHHSVAARPHDHTARRDGKTDLAHPPVRFTGEQARTIALAFGTRAAKSGITLHALSIMPDHVHFVAAPHRYRVEQVCNLLKGAATKALRDAGLWQEKHSPWGVGLWKVFLDSPGRVTAAIRYVEENPVKAGLRRQRWSFVVPYDE